MSCNISFEYFLAVFFLMLNEFEWILLIIQEMLWFGIYLRDRSTKMVLKLKVTVQDAGKTPLPFKLKMNRS